MKTLTTGLALGLFFVGCATHHQREMETAFYQVERVLELKSYEKELSRLPDLRIAAVTNNEPIFRPGTKERVRGFYAKGTAVCDQDDLPCWQHEYVHHLASRLEKSEIEELLARLVVNYFEIENRAERAELRVKDYRRSR